MSSLKSGHNNKICNWRAREKNEVARLFAFKLHERRLSSYDSIRTSSERNQLSCTEKFERLKRTNNAILFTLFVLTV